MRKDFLANAFGVEFLGDSDQLREGFGLHLFHNLMAMELHGYFADIQSSGDLFIKQTADHQFHHLTLARR